MDFRCSKNENVRKPDDQTVKFKTLQIKNDKDSRSQSCIQNCQTLLSFNLLVFKTSRVIFYLFKHWYFGPNTI